MKGATDVIGTSPEGAVVYYIGRALRIREDTGGDSHWTVHEFALVQDEAFDEAPLVGIIPKSWAVTLKLPV
jgi:hypothetical protein